MNYHEAMFAHTREPLSDAERFLFSERIAFHEAGHAVVGYALGFGCSRIELRETYKVAERLIYPSGAYFMTRASAARLAILPAMSLDCLCPEPASIGFPSFSRESRRRAYLGITTIAGLRLSRSPARDLFDRSSGT